VSFRALHQPGTPLLLPNPWDIGSAKLLAGLGFSALGSTSAGAAFAAGKKDGNLSLTQMFDEAAAIKAASGLPVTADAENGGGDTPEDAANAVTQAIQRGLDGISIEDLSNDGTIYPFEHTMARAQAALAARGTSDIVVTIRTEIMLSASADFPETLRRIAAYHTAGADVVYAPGLRDATQVRDVISAANGTPVNVLTGNNQLGLSVQDLAALGVARISIGSGFARLAYGAVMDMAETMLPTGKITYPATTAGFAAIEKHMD